MSVQGRVRLLTPLDDPAVESLKAGQLVSLSGLLYTARDAAHRRFADLLAAGRPLPVDLKGQVLYYAGPAPARPGRPIGPIGPTSSYRMDPYTPRLLELGLKAAIGKGSRSQAVADALASHKAVYLAATGGAAVLLSRCVRSASVAAFEDLGPEAVFRLEVEDLPLVVANDCHGGDVYRLAKL